ncbi:MAG: AAA family ATPase [Gemmatimonadota bacterium]
MLRIITVSRQMGSGGSEIAARLAGTLGWSLLDNAMVDRVASGLGVTPAQVEAIEERVPSLAARVADTLAMGAQEPLSALLPTTNQPTEERLLEVTSRVVDDAVERGPVVLVGRGAQARLDNRPDAFHVLCVAPREVLVARISARYAIGTDEAGKRVDEINRHRAGFVQRHWKRAWLDPSHYHLCVNTGLIGIDGAMETVLEALRRLDRDLPRSKP